MRMVAAEFIKSCVSPEQFPDGALPEIAFVGRSNVGKSSLINSLLHRRDLAKVSRTPGKTRAVNLFLVSTSDPELARFYLVDLPGYGFAKVSKAERQEWAPLMEAYLGRREAVAGVVLLVESRVVTEQDRQTLAWLRSLGHHPLVVGTKADRVKPAERVRTLRQACETLGMGERDVIFYSATSHAGRDRLWAALKQLVRT